MDDDRRREIQRNYMRKMNSFDPSPSFGGSITISPLDTFLMKRSKMLVEFRKFIDSLKSADLTYGKVAMQGTDAVLNAVRIVYGLKEKEEPEWIKICQMFAGGILSIFGVLETLVTTNLYNEAMTLLSEDQSELKKILPILWECKTSLQAMKRGFEGEGENHNEGILGCSKKGQSYNTEGNSLSQLLKVVNPITSGVTSPKIGLMLNLKSIYSLLQEDEQKCFRVLERRYQEYLSETLRLQELRDGLEERQSPDTIEASIQTIEDIFSKLQLE